MTQFRYLRPATLEEAQALLTVSGPKGILLAGGTDLLVQIRAGKNLPTHLVDLKGIQGLTSIRARDGKIFIGALATIGEILKSDLVRAKLPILADACARLGNVQTRNKATIGGNICNASPSAETAGPLLALEARVQIFGQNGERTLSINEFFLGPGKKALAFAEIVTGIIVPFPSAATGMCYLKLGRRKAMEIAIANVAVAVEKNGDSCYSSRIALGAVAPTPMRALAAEAILSGASWTQEIIAAAADAAAQACQPISDIRASAWYRRKVVRVLVRRALQAAWEGTELK